MEIWDRNRGNMRKASLIFIFLAISVILLALIYKISRLEEVNGELRQIKRQYEQICTRYGGNNCE